MNGNLSGPGIHRVPYVVVGTVADIVALSPVACVQAKGGRSRVQLMCRYEPEAIASVIVSSRDCAVYEVGNMGCSLAAAPIPLREGFSIRLSPPVVLRSYHGIVIDVDAGAEGCELWAYGPRS